jgi:arylsulfatase
MRIKPCLLAIIVIAAWLVSVFGSPAAVAKPCRPNIILVMPDDLGYGDYSCLGNPVMKTPAVDAFWKQSVRLTDFHVSPTCSPTRAALLSGRHEFKNGVTHTILERERMSLSTITLAQVLKSAGYATGIFGKWHLGDEAPYQPDRRGFEEVLIHGGGGIGQTYPGSCGDAPGNSYQNPALLHNGVFERTQGYCTDVFFGRAIQWMDAQRKAGVPFFAYIAPNVAHEPLQCPEENYQHYAGKVPEQVARFYGMIETLDRNFGLLLAELSKWGLENDTLIIFLGTDNGGYGPACEIFNAGMRGGKGSPYQGGTRAPCFWRWPAKLQGGRDVSALTAHIDIFPTLAEIVGIPLKDDLAKQLEGRSLLPLLTNPKADWPDRFLVTHVGRWPRGKVASAKFQNCSIRDRRFTLVNNQELYDLANDPGERKNVMADYPEQVAKLRAAYDRWWRDVQPLLVNESAMGPKVNPMKELYWKQFGGGPDEKLRELMDPNSAANKGKYPGG